MVVCNIAGDFIMTEKGKNKNAILVLIILVILLATIGLVEYGIICKNIEKNRQLSTLKKQVEEETKDGVKEHGKLKVVGVQLRDEKGNNVQLRGMSSHGILWYPDYINYASIMETKKHGANMFRIAMYSDGGGDGYIKKPELSKRLMYQAVENVLSADMYAIVDWHILNDGNPNTNIEKAKEFFKEITGAYKNNLGIIYEICNEPNGDTTWDDIVKYADEIIPIIRNNATDAIILVGTPDYSYSVTKVEKKLEYDNIMYSYHFYAGQYDDSYQYMIGDAQRAGVPVFVSEWGINTENNKETALQQGKKFAEYINKENISFAAWSLCNKDECFSAIKPECIKYSGWNDEDLTEVGKILFSALNGDK